MPIVALTLAGGCIEVDDSPSMQAELRAARAELVEATEQLREATRELTAATKELNAQKAEASPIRIAKGDEIAAVGELRCQPETRCSISRKAFDLIRGDTKRLSRQATLRPRKVKNEIQGFVLSRVREGSLPAALGLRDGDVLASVQGIDLDAPNKLGSILSRIAGAKNLTAVVRREGHTFTVRVRVQ